MSVRICTRTELQDYNVINRAADKSLGNFKANCSWRVSGPRCSS